jgi:cellulose synthase/poly-beta-1,6-N-acetylglucosamine synthase-like glycosyltransferase
VIALSALAALSAIAVPFVLYPLLLWLRASWSEETVAAADCTPRVDLIICAHDEEASIRSKLENALSLDYPADLLTIWVASDGSTDSTVAIARSFESDGVRVLDLPRGGKVSVLTAAVAASKAEVLAFSDANSMWQTGALRALVRPLADDRVGGVAGDQRYSDRIGECQDEAQEAAADHALGERTYWSFDRQLKDWQSRAGSVISATGAIYAVRRSLFSPPPADATDDFMISTEVIARGRRLVFALDAVAIEPAAEDSAGEFRRKVRVITRGLRAVYYRRALLRPSAGGSYAIEFLLHKLWRRLTWIPLLVLFLMIPTYWSAGGLLAVLAIALAASLSMGLAGLAVPALCRYRVVSVAAYVVMVNSACALATLNAVRGHRVSQWDSARSTESVTGQLS